MANDNNLLVKGIQAHGISQWLPPFQLVDQNGTVQFSVDSSGNVTAGGNIAGGASGNQTVSGNLSVTGTSTLTGAVSAASTLSAVGITDTGTSTLTTLNLSGNLAINTNKFTVTASSGNTVVAGTLGVTGAATLSSTLASGALTVTGAATISTTLGVTGATTLTGGIASAIPSTTSAVMSDLCQVVPIGGVAYTSLGTSTAAVNNQVNFSSIFVPCNVTVTNMNILNGATAGGSNKWIGIIYSAAGAVLGNTALAGTATSGPNTFQAIPLTSTLALAGPATYFVGVQQNGTTDTLRYIAASTYVGVLTGSAAGTFGTAASITPPTTFTAGAGPIIYFS